MTELFNTFIVLFAVIDPIGTVPVFIAVTRSHQHEAKRAIAIRAVLVAAGVLVFFIVLGQYVLEAASVPLSAFQVAGGIVLFLFALTMIFGEGKPAEEVKVVKSHHETAIFPLAVPSIASPGAMVAVVMLTDNHRFSVLHQLSTTLVMLFVLCLALALLMASTRIYRWIGDPGASIISRVMGLILGAVAVNSVLEGIKTYFSI